jgi:NitT/TauT family transport system substrate-binding protein
MVDFLADAMVATRWYLDPKNQDEAVKIASDFAKAPPALFTGWLFSQKDYFRDPTLKLDIPAFQANMDLQKQMGFLKDRIDIGKYVDSSLIEAAAKRLQ